MNNKTSNKILVALLLLLATVSVGYAAIATTLNITGTSKISTATWDVHFENIAVTAGSVTATTPAAIQTNKTQINYAVNLAKPGDFYEFTVVVKNAGSLNAKLSQKPTLTGPTTQQDTYTNYTVTYSDGSAIGANDTLDATASKTVKVRIEYDKNITATQLPTSEQNISLSYSMNFIQA